MLLNPEPDPLNAFEVQEILWTRPFKVREKIAVNRTEPDRGKPTLFGIEGKRRDQGLLQTPERISWPRMPQSCDTCPCPPAHHLFDYSVLFTYNRLKYSTVLLLCHTCNSYVVTRDRGFSLDSSTATG